jgi:hypothetical protein
VVFWIVSGDVESVTRWRGKLWAMMGVIERHGAVGPLIQSFTAQPEAPADTKAGASGWAVN